MILVERYAHDIAEINGIYFVVDTCKAPDTMKWETGIAELNLSRYIDSLIKEGTIETASEITDDDIFYYLNEINLWDLDFEKIIQHKNKMQAIKYHDDFCKQGRILNR